MRPKRTTHYRDRRAERPAHHKVCQRRSIDRVSRRLSLIRRVDRVDARQRRKGDADVALRHAQAEERQGENDRGKNDALTGRRPSREPDNRKARGARARADAISPDQLS